MVVFKGRRRNFGGGLETGTTTIWETAGNPEDFSIRHGEPTVSAVKVADLGWRTFQEARGLAEDLEAPLKDLPYKGPNII